MLSEDSKDQTQNQDGDQDEDSSNRDRNGTDPKDQDFLQASAEAIDKSWWSSFASMLATRELAKAWVELFDVTTSRRYNKTAESTKFLYRLDLSRDMTGYQIGPHTDTDKKWVTTLFYLPSSAKHANVGTTLLKSTTGRTQQKGTKHMKFGPEWEAVFAAPFVPNSVMAFAPCWHSWHYVPKVAERVTRDTLQGFIQGFGRTTGRKKVQCGGT